MGSSEIESACWRNPDRLLQVVCYYTLKSHFERESSQAKNARGKQGLRFEANDRVVCSSLFPYWR